MIKPIAITAAVLVGAVLVLAATRPDTFRVQRAATMQAPPEKIFPLINDFDRWAAWSPYEKKDPGMKRTRSGPAAGKGAVYGWEGNGEVGQGRMEIADSAAPSRVTIRLDFAKPFEAHNIVDFTLQPKGNATEVTWAMHGPARERVFAAWTRAEHLAHWFGPRGFTIHSAETDPRPGGLFRLCLRSPEAKDYWVHGAFREVAPPDRLVIACRRTTTRALRAWRRSST